MNNTLRDEIMAYEQEDSDNQSLRGQVVFDWMINLLLRTGE